MANDSTIPGFDPETAQWRKSSFSSVGECVAVAALGDRVVVRNTNAPEAGMLVLSKPQVAAWITGIKAGEFDDLVS